MMNYEIFKEVVKEKFMDYMPEKFKGMELVAEPVEKVNVTLDGIILREEGRNISPTIYINDMYKKYQDCGDLEETLMAACDFMERAYEQAPVVDVDSIMRDANEKIVFQLINTEQNKTFLEQVPHREFQDLSIVYKVIISADKDAVQSSKITNEFAKRLGMSEGGAPCSSFSWHSRPCLRCWPCSRTSSAAAWSSPAAAAGSPVW